MFQVPSSTRSNKASSSGQKSLRLSSSSSLLSITPSHGKITSLFSPAKAKLPYKEYTNLLQKKMKKYRVNSPVYLENLEENNKTILNDSRFITKDEEKFIQKIYSSNHSFFSRGLSPTNEDSSLKISVQNNADFINPIHSLGVIKSNNMIYDELTNTNLKRQIGVFDDSIKNYEAYTMKYKTKMPKIRITSLLPKFSNSIPVIDQTDDKKKRESMLNFVEHTNSSKNKLFAYYRYPNKNFPETREQFSMVLHRGNVILVGGMCSVMQTTFIWSLDVINLTWKRVTAQNMLYNRFGHTCVAYQNKLYVYGGRTKFNASNKENADLLNGLDYFNLDDNVWYSPVISSKNAPRPRRNHVAELIGNQMIIHGGINENGEIANNCYLLNLTPPLKWLKISVSSFETGPFLYGHASALVVPQVIRNSYRFSLYKYPDNTVNKTNSLNKIKEVGWYIFGGKTKDEKLTNDLWVLCLGKKPLEWKKIEIDKGIRPSPRYFLSMNYYEEGNFLIIHGGRNDEQSDSFALNDTFIFDLDSLDWTKVELYSQLTNFKILSRCAHSSVVFSNKLIIFGGMNSNNYLGSALLIVNLDWEYSTKFKTAEEIMIEKIKNDRKNREKSKDKKDKNKKTLEEEEEELQMLEKLQKLKSTINKNQLGIVSNLDLPPIK